MVNTPLSAQSGQPRALRILPAVVLLFGAASAVGTFIGVSSTDPISRGLPVALLLSALPLLLGALSTLLLSRLLAGGLAQVRSQVNAERLALMELATHQLGAPLATFRWWLELFKDSDAETVIDRKEIAGQVGEAVARLDSIVKALTNASNVEVGKLATQDEVLGSIRHIVLQVVQDMTPKLEAQCQKMTVSVEENIPALEVDGLLVRSTLQELVSNAIDFSPPNTEITINVTSNKRKNTAEVEVRDQGHGIPASDQPHIFEKFFRASNAAQLKPVGNGMGLFNAKAVTEKMGGEMRFKSKQGKGSAFTFTLPFTRKTSDPKPVKVASIVPKI